MKNNERYHAVSEYIKEIASLFDVSYESVISESKVREVMEVRHLIAALLAARGNSYVRIGEWLGSRDHSTISNSIKRMERMKEIVDTYYELMEDITASGGDG